ncbi:hypothetical protein [Ketogulonicigenium vulgare]|uniref:hypothetical protein n=1 Tax=Ketogulonicigenium vulgare TaxID=92945 RepID=UPI002358CFB0|nr:hypothetical protein [Ketogulonicigenium vulgare]
MREVILVRTHYADADVLNFFDHMAHTSGRDIVFVCDESNGVVNVGQGRAKVSITADYMSSLGLYAPKNWGWLCGDYFLYAGQKALPHYDRYWLVESDVRFNMERCSDFFDHFSARASDLVVAHSFKSTPKWYWHRPMSYFIPDVYACLFPLLGVSNAGIQAAFNARVLMSQTFRDIVPEDQARRWPNDESFLISTLLAQGFSHEKINSADQKFYSAETFSVGTPKSLSALEGQGYDGLIYHPVHAKERFVSKIKTRTRSVLNQQLDEARKSAVFNETFFRDLALEGTEQDVADIRAMIEEALIS